MTFIKSINVKCIIKQYKKNWFILLQNKLSIIITNMSESEKYSTTIPNIKDNDGDDVYLKKIFSKKLKILKLYVSNHLIQKVGIFIKVHYQKILKIFFILCLPNSFFNIFF